ncbi:MAG: hypothetical protein FWF08_06920 [Oscillospiraceae bacterium]|nr:hypothetical protein [Oscillospiraceae bacterium]
MFKTKKIIACFLAVVLFLPVWAAAFSFSASAAVKTGDDGVTNWDFIEPVTHLKQAPTGYKPVYTVADLDNIRNDLSANYILMNDINLAEVEWKPIAGNIDLGNVPRQEVLNANAFTGIFDGNGYVVKNMNNVKALTIDVFNWFIPDDPDELLESFDEYIGLFGFVYEGIIKNIGMTGASVNFSAHERGSLSVGGIVAEATSSSFINCFNTVNISIFSDNTELTLLAGIGNSYNSNLISKCFNSGNLVANGSGWGFAVTGIVFEGGAANSLIEKCFNSGSLTVKNLNGMAYVSGIAVDTGGSLVDCYNTGNITAIAPNTVASASGIITQVGYSVPVFFTDEVIESDGFVTRCYNTGIIKAESDFYGNKIIGAITVGFATKSSLIEDCYYFNNIPSFIYLDFSFRPWLSIVVEGDEEIINNDPADPYPYLNEDGFLINVKSLSKIEMRNKSSYKGFDFDNVWRIDSTKNSGYPYLRYSEPDDVTNIFQWFIDFISMIIEWLQNLFSFIAI